MLLSAGERISMALLSMAIRELGGDAISFTGSQSGIITNDRHVDARIIEVRPFRVQDELARGKIVVDRRLPGRLLQEGGDDARDAAAATRPPWPWRRRSTPSTARSVPTSTACIRPTRASWPARARIGTLSYEETQEMAEAGAKVLNAQAVEFAKEKGIAIYARATSGPLPGPDPSSDGTVVRKSPPRMPGTVVGVASERDLIVLDSRRASRPTCWRCSTSAASPASSCTSSATGPRSSSRARTCTTRRTCGRRSTAHLQGRAQLDRRPGRRQRDRRGHQCHLCERSRRVARRWPRRASSPPASPRRRSESPG